MSSALKMAKLEPSSIDMVNVHATSTPVGDEIEARSILSLFKNASPCITANKGLIGHTFASAGAI
jgi:3-oxoacyl-[acyl-carrier-protein] synthase II